MADEQLPTVHLEAGSKLTINWRPELQRLITLRFAGKMMKQVALMPGEELVITAYPAPPQTETLTVAVDGVLVIR